MRRPEIYSELLEWLHKSFSVGGVRGRLAVVKGELLTKGRCTITLKLLCASGVVMKWYSDRDITCIGIEPDDVGSLENKLNYLVKEQQQTD